MSIDRLGGGELGLLARIEFGLSPQTERERFIKTRRAVAKQRLRVGDEALARLERHMHLELAEDLVGRYGDRQPVPM